MDIKVPFPLRGLSDAAAITEQPQLTARVAENVRAVGKKSNRVRGGTRPGTTKLVDALVDSGGTPRKVVDIQSISVDQPNVTWTRNATGNNVYGTVAESLEPTAIEVDSVGDVYCCIGTSTIKRYNSLMVEQEAITVPVQSEEHMIRPMKVDELFSIYVSDVQLREFLSDGTDFTYDAKAGDQAAARIWKFRRSTITGKYELDWTIETGAFVHALEVVNGVLYTVQNDVSQKRARIVGYGGLDTPEPFVSWTRENIPYPANDIDIDEGGDLFTAHGADANRGENPKFPGFTAIRADGWSPKNLTDWQKRVWAWFRPETLEEDNPGIEDGDEIQFWRDSSGNGRHLIRDLTDASWKGPIYRKEGVAGLPSVEFQGDQWLTSGPNVTTAKSGDSMQATILPSSLNASNAGESMFSLFATVRPDFSSDVGALIGYRNATGGDSDHVILTNRPEGTGTPGSALAGFISVFEDTSAGTNTAHGSSDHPLAGYYGPATNASAGGDSDGDFSAADGTWTTATNRLTSTGTFAGYTVGSENVGDWIQVTGGTGVTTGFYKADSKIDNDTIQLETSMSGSDQAAGDIAFSGAFHILEFDANDVGCGVLTHVCDSGVQEAGYTDEYTRSLLRFNGTALDRYSSIAHYTEEAVDLGRYNKGAFSSGVYYKGQIREFLVVVPESDTNTSTIPNDGAILTHPGYDPWGVGGESALGATVSDEMLRVEGYMAWNSGISHLLDPPADTGFIHPYKDVVPIPLDEDNVVNGDITGAFPADVNQLNDTGAMTCKWSGANGSLIWVIDDDFQTGTGGCGTSVRVQDGRVYTFGPSDANSSDKLKSFPDTGLDFTTTTGAWGDIVSSGPLLDPLAKIKLDSEGAVYVPILRNDNVDGDGGAFVFAPDGTELCEIPSRPFFAVGAPFQAPAYPSAFTDDKSSAYLYLGSKSDSYGGIDSDPPPYTLGLGPFSGLLYRYEIVEAALSAAEERALVTLAVADGQIKKQGASSWEDITGGGTAGDRLWVYTASRYVSSTPYVGGGGVYVFYTNGLDYYYYDAFADEVKEFVPTSGTVGDRFRLFASWRGRLVGARTAENPQYWAMSAVGEPFNWQFNPAIVTVTQAIDGVNAEAGEVPDIVNGFIPYSDDVAIWGGDRSLWRMSGDPMAGGQFDSITKSIGMAFGRAWAVDDDGTIYFYATNGAFYRMRPGDVLPVRMSSNTIENRLNDIDQGDYFVRMEYDVKRQGLWIVQCPFGQSESTAPKSWFWDKRNGDVNSGWWQDQFVNEDHTITALGVIDGDAASDRRVVFGSQDSYVRYWDDTVDTDDSSALVSRVVFGPLAPDDGREYRLKQPQVVLAADQGGAVLELYGDTDPSFLAAPMVSAQLDPGRNDVKHMAARGAHVYAGLRSKEAWEFESMNLKGHRAGKAKLRV